ncbi:hypothetical protein ANO11243_028380 [Dothideomycetidae sp. 11243]|nr:hypothetical protein ANO11243_028380 [fungal sp. No.11243]
MPRASRSAAEHDPNSHLHWTASRCLRLLRPISSRIEPLRRLAQEERTRRGVHSWSGDESDSANPDREPAWLPQPSHGRTYSKRRKHNSAAASTRAVRDDSEPIQSWTELPTPFRSAHVDMVEPMVSSLQPQGRDAPPSSPITPVVERAKAPLFGLTGSHAARSTPRGQKRTELEGGLVQGLAGLLERTGGRKGDGQKRTGASSLTGMCLRSVPRVINLETRIRREMDPDADDDVAGEIYAELEDWGPHAVAGYSGLCQVVRAHGLALMLHTVKHSDFSHMAILSISRALERFGSRSERLALRLAILYRRDGSAKCSESYPGRDALTSGALTLHAADMGPDLPPSVLGQAIKDGVIGLRSLSSIWALTQSKAVSQGAGDGRLVSIGIVLETACLGITHSPETGTRGPTVGNAYTTAPEITRITQSFEKMIEMFGAMILAIRSAHSEDWRLAVARAIRSMLYLVVEAILRQHPKLKRCAGWEESERYRAILVTKVLTTFLALQILDVDTAGERATFSYVALADSIKFWSHIGSGQNAKMSPVPAILVSLVWCSCSKDQLRSETLIKTLSEALLRASKESDRSTAQFLQMTALQVAHTFAILHRSKAGRIIARDVEEAVHAIDRSVSVSLSIIANAAEEDSEVTRFQWDDGLQEWLAAGSCAGVSRASTGLEDVVDDSGYQSVDRVEASSHTPKQHLRKLDLASPDELGLVLKGPLPEVTLEDVRPSTYMAARSDELNRSRSEEEETYTIEGFVQEDSPSELDDRDELMMSVRKRRAPADEMPWSRVRNVRRRWTARPHPESEDELG